MAIVLEYCPHFSMLANRSALPLLVFLSTTLILPAASQSDRAAADLMPSFLSRIERLQIDQDVCVLVSRNGQYRLERRYPATTQVFIGSLSVEELQRLEGMLNSNELQALSQSQIPHLLVSDTIDELLIDVLRPSGMQSLKFDTRESRKKFRASVDPLLSWLDAIQKQPHTQLREESASHCMPPRAPDPDGTATRSASSQLHLPFVMMMRTEHVANGLAENRCVILYQDGKFRREQSKQRFHSTMRVQAFEGSVGKDRLAKLQMLLDSAPIKTLQHQSVPGKIFREAEFIFLTIPRPGSVQNLAFADYFGVLDSPKVAGGLNGNNDVLDRDERVIKPLQRWIKDNIDRDKVPAIPNPQATSCAPRN